MIGDPYYGGGRGSQSTPPPGLSRPKPEAWKATTNASETVGPIARGRRATEATRKSKISKRSSQPDQTAQTGKLFLGLIGAAAKTYAESKARERQNRKETPAENSSSSSGSYRTGDLVYGGTTGVWRLSAADYWKGVVMSKNGDVYRIKIKDVEKRAGYEVGDTYDFLKSEIRGRTK